MIKKIEPKILPGFMELLPSDQIAFNDMYDKIRMVYEKFGFLPLDTPVLEYSDILCAKAGGETEKQIYRFNKGDNDLALRFDLTVPLARYVSQRYNDLNFPFKRYQMSKVFRGERPQNGRFREFYQCDIDIIGNEELDIIYEAEMPTVIYNVFKELNIGKFTIKVNNRKILNGFFESLNLNNKITDILRIIDKIDKIGRDEVENELQKIGIDNSSVDKILEFIQIKGNTKDVLSKLKENDIDNECYTKGVKELEEVVNYLEQFGVPDEYYKIDLTIARGLDYYTGTIYETNLDEYPKLGSICSGGRYDNLTEFYTDKKLPGIGISIGLTRLFSKLKENNIIENKRKSLVDVLVIPMDKNCMKYSLDVASKLRNQGIGTDIYYMDKGLKQKIKYADRLGIRYIAIIGEDEILNNNITLKDLSTSNQEVLDIDIAINMLKKAY